MAPSSNTGLKPTPADLAEVFRIRYGDPRTTGPLPRLWHRLHYFNPDIFYEAMVAKLVRRESTWLDVGCGGGIFPSNGRLAQMLAQHCKTLVGVDPDAQNNPFVHIRAKSTIEEFTSDNTFDLVTLRMVAEHIQQPDSAVASLARLTKPGGKVIIYTINLWSPVSLISWLVPSSLHHAIKRILWSTEERDTFPVAYQLNTRERLRQLFETERFREVYFAHLDHCCLFYRLPHICCLELLLWRTLKMLGITYPENCLLAVYERV